MSSPLRNNEYYNALVTTATATRNYFSTLSNTLSSIRVSVPLGIVMNGDCCQTTVPSHTCPRAESSICSPPLHPWADDWLLDGSWNHIRARSCGIGGPDGESSRIPSIAAKGRATRPLEWIDSPLYIGRAGSRIHPIHWRHLHKRYPTDYRDLQAWT